MASDPDESTFKILIATDNHLGYLEQDPVRGQDSFRTFEEILEIADQAQVDFILLGGDLFHHNRPSRSCLYQTMKMLRRHCFGERPSKVWIASDQSVNFPDEFCRANYLDENLNIGMPVFSIHGNHDDPSGVGNLCALNLLQVSGMINYFGASSSIEDVTVTPILMQKGESKLALYGLGNIREERLHRQWKSGHVRFMRPEDEEWHDCFNMFVFHQNRARHGPTSHIPEEFIGSFFDLVLWGHEHECRIVAEEQEHFAITQPGSSVATSLSQGEAEPKHVGLLTIEGNQYKLDKIRLKTTRPLQFTTVVLSRIADLSPSDTKGIQTYLESVVETLIERAKLDWEEQQQQSPYHLSMEGPGMEMPTPLIRVRIDYSGGYETFNPQQFGQKFVDRVANPKEILKFQRHLVQARTIRPSSEAISDLSTILPERLDTLKVEDLVGELLSRDLFILPETGLEKAVMSLVEKSDKDAIRTFVTKSVVQTREAIAVIPEDLTLEYIKQKSTESKESQDQPRQQLGNYVEPTQELQGHTNSVNNNNDSDDDLLSSFSTPTQRSRGRSTVRAPSSQQSSRASPMASVILSSDEEQESDYQEDAERPPINNRRNTKKRAAPARSSSSPSPPPPAPSLLSSQATSSSGKRRRVLRASSQTKKR